MIAKDLRKFDNLYRRFVRVIWYKENSGLDAIREKEFSGGYAFAHEDIVQYIMTIIPQEEVIVEATRKSIISLRQGLRIRTINLQKPYYLQRFHLK